MAPKGRGGRPRASSNEMAARAYNNHNHHRPHGHKAWGPMAAMPARAALSPEARAALELLLRADDPAGDARPVGAAALVDAIRRAVVNGEAPAGEELAARVSRRFVVTGADAIDARRCADVVRLVNAIPALAPHMPKVDAAMAAVVEDLPFLDHADVAWVSVALMQDGPCFWSDDVFASAGAVASRWPSTVDVVRPFLVARLNACKGDSVAVGRLVGAVLKVCGGERNDGYIVALAAHAVEDEGLMMAWALVASGRADLAGTDAFGRVATSTALLITAACGATELMQDLAKALDGREDVRSLVQEGLGHYLGVLDLPGFDAHHVHAALKVHPDIRVDMGALLKKHRFAGTVGFDLVATLVLAYGRAM